MMYEILLTRVPAEDGQVNSDRCNQLNNSIVGDSR